MESEDPCEACGYANLSTARFCAECGSNLNLKRFDSVKSDISIDKNNINEIVDLMNEIENLSNIGNELQQQQNFENSIENQLRESENRLESLEVELDFESEDVDRLERLTFTSIFAKIKGEYDERLAREMEEQALAAEKYQAAREDYEEILEQYNLAVKQRKEFENLEKKYQLMKKQLDDLLAKTFEEVSHPEEDRLENEVDQLTQKRNTIRNDLDRHRLALNHLRSAHSYFDRAYEKLSSADNYATWDTFFDGGIIADSMKHSRWDDARSNIRSANRQINTARNVFPNLPSIFVHSDRTGSDFFDVWMDNIFSDFRARDQIRQSRDQVLYAMNSVRGIIRELERTITTKQQNLDSVNKEYSTVYSKLREKRLELFKEFIEGTQK